MASRVAVICGYGIGISAAMAKRLGSEGFKLAIVARSQSALDAAAADLNSAGCQTKAYAIDLSNPSAVKATVTAVQAELGPIHMLFWNPGSLATSGLHATSEELVTGYNTLVTGFMAAVQACYNDLKATKGAILVTGGGMSMESDKMAQLALEWNTAAAAITKAAQRKLVHILHKGFAADGIYVAEVTIMSIVKGTRADVYGNATLTTESVADEFWSLYTTRDPAVWFVLKA